jgi:SnoaL-like polyketide cyclase
MPQDAEAIVRRWFEEVWNQGREETIDELFASEAIRPGLGESEAPIQGPKQFKPFFRNMRATFPDLHTGRKVHVPGMIITQVSGGKITGAHNIWDQHVAAAWPLSESGSRKQGSLLRGCDAGCLT